MTTYCIDTSAGPRVTARLNLHSVWQRAYRFRAFHLGFGSYKSAWMLAHKIRRAMEIADGFPLIADMQADETGIPYRFKGSEPPPGGRSREGRLMIAGAVEVFGETGPRMKSSSGSTACSRTSNAGASASCTDSDASIWTGSSSNGRSDGTGASRAAKACSRCSDPGRTRPRRQPCA